MKTPVRVQPNNALAPDLLQGLVLFDALYSALEVGDEPDPKALRAADQTAPEGLQKLYNACAFLADVLRTYPFVTLKQLPEGLRTKAAYWQDRVDAQFRQAGLLSA